MRGVHPPTHLREQLTDARRAGIGFDDAWSDCLSHATRGGCSPRSRAEWRLVLEGTRSAWRAAYEREPITDTSTPFAQLLERDEPSERHDASLIA